MIRQHRRPTGFTIIELMLAMSFVGMLLLSIAMVTIQISHIYTKGTTLRQVNQAGRALSDELQRAIEASGPVQVTGADTHYVDQGQGGRLCLGAYSYVWNNGAALATAAAGGASAPNNYSAGSTPIRFIKVADSGAALCAKPNTKIAQSAATELLASGDRELVVHKVSVTQTAADPASNQAMYAISLTIGSNDQNELLADNSCKPPSSSAGGEDYCAVNQFDIIARAGSNTGGK